MQHTINYRDLEPLPKQWVDSQMTYHKLLQDNGALDLGAAGANPKKVRKYIHKPGHQGKAEVHMNLVDSVGQHWVITNIPLPYSIVVLRDKDKNPIPYMVLNTLGSGAFGTVKRCLKLTNLDEHVVLDAGSLGQAATAEHYARKKLTYQQNVKYDTAKLTKYKEAVFLKLAKLKSGEDNVLIEELKRLISIIDNGIKHNDAGVVDTNLTKTAAAVIADLRPEIEADTIIMPFMNGSSVQSFMKTHNVDLISALKILISAEASLEELQKLGVAHRDIKPDNFIVEQKGNDFVAHPVDFGTAEVAQYATDCIGTNEYIAPEVYNMSNECRYLKPNDLRGENDLLFADRYSAAQLFWCILGMKPPIEKDTEIHAIKPGEDPYQKDEKILLFKQNPDAFCTQFFHVTLFEYFKQEFEAGPVCQNSVFWSRLDTNAKNYILNNLFHLYCKQSGYHRETNNRITRLEEARHRGSCDITFNELQTLLDTVMDYAYPPAVNAQSQSVKSTVIGVSTTTHLQHPPQGMPTGQIAQAPAALPTASGNIVEHADAHTFITDPPGKRSDKIKRNVCIVLAFICAFFAPFALVAPNVIALSVALVVLASLCVLFFLGAYKYDVLYKNPKTSPNVDSAASFPADYLQRQGTDAVPGYAVTVTGPRVNDDPSLQAKL